MAVLVEQAGIRTLTAQAQVAVVVVVLVEL
jgi:hypothetical protein